MVPEAPLEQTEAGLVPAGEGWFVVNAKESRWFEHDTFGSGVTFEGEGEAGFKEVGVNIGVMEPGQPACMYHRENQQEDFLVLFGECLAECRADCSDHEPWCLAERADAVTEGLSSRREHDRLALGRRAARRAESRYRGWCSLVRMTST